MNPFPKIPICYLFDVEVLFEPVVAGFDASEFVEAGTLPLETGLDVEVADEVAVDVAAVVPLAVDTAPEVVGVGELAEFVLGATTGLLPLLADTFGVTVLEGTTFDEALLPPPCGKISAIILS